jgi:hypothetical protein
MGIVETSQHDLIHGYPVLAEKQGEIVAQFKWTIAVKKENPVLIAGHLIDQSLFTSNYKISEPRLLKLFEEDLDNFLPNSKKTSKIDPSEKARRKKEAKQKKKAEVKKAEK